MFNSLLYLLVDIVTSQVTTYDKPTKLIGPSSGNGQPLVLKQITYP